MASSIELTEERPVKPAILKAKSREQEYGSDPLQVRETDHYKAEYVHGFVEKWDALIDWEARASSEGRFFIDILKARGKKNILDVATGTGFHSVQLLKAGFDVVSADGSAEMLSQGIRQCARPWPHPENGLGGLALAQSRPERPVRRDCLPWEFVHPFVQRKGPSPRAGGVLFGSQT